MYCAAVGWLSRSLARWLAKSINHTHTLSVTRCTEDEHTRLLLLSVFCFVSVVVELSQLHPFLIRFLLSVNYSNYSLLIILIIFPFSLISPHHFPSISSSLLLLLLPSHHSNPIPSPLSTLEDNQAPLTHTSLPSNLSLALWGKIDYSLHFTCCSPHPPPSLSPLPLRITFTLHCSPLLIPFTSPTLSLHLISSLLSLSILSLSLYPSLPFPSLCLLYLGHTMHPTPSSITRVQLNT